MDPNPSIFNLNLYSVPFSMVRFFSGENHKWFQHKSNDLKKIHGNLNLQSLGIENKGEQIGWPKCY